MGEVIGRCSSRKEALRTLEQAEVFVPSKAVYAYTAALNRVRYEFRRHDPLKPVKGKCGACGAVLVEDSVYCWNCGREILIDETD